jgi:hypothetical protein
VVTIFVFPSEALGDAAKLLDRAAGNEAQGAVERIHEELLSRLDLEFFAESFGDHDLKFGRDANLGFLDWMKPPSMVSIGTSYVNTAIDRYDDIPAAAERRASNSNHGC